jgi:glutamine cyclotransferase
MRTSLRKIVLIISTSPLLLAVLCEKDNFDTLAVPNETKVSISQGPNFSLNDTIWVSGQVSSMLFDEVTSDSIRNPNETIKDLVDVLQLTEENGDSNTKEALIDFEIIVLKGVTELARQCPESKLITVAELRTDMSFYEYEIGFVAKTSGDFVLSWEGPIILKNDNRNTEILNSYPVKGETNFLGLTNCEITSLILDVESSGDEFFFTVN